MELLFWIGELGILLEIAGAAVLLYFAWQESKEMRPPARITPKQAEGAAERILTKQTQERGKKTWVGFLFLAIGLIMQLIGNFGDKPEHPFKFPF